MKTRSFIDQVEVQVRSGKGGDGAASFRREALVPFGGPDGGDGGRGGDVVLRGSTHVNSLISLFFEPRLFAEDGVPGSGGRCFGRRGKDLVVDVPCGTWLELRALPHEDCRFVQWSDGNTSAVRQVEVTDDATYIAFFAANCEEYANLPVVALYDWLLMLDVRSVQAKGYWFAEKDVAWYRVKGEPDLLSDNTGKDDEFICRGYYLTLDKHLGGTGDYYAVVDVSSSPSGVLCTGLMRSLIVHYSSAASASRRTPVLEPTCVRANAQQRLLYLDEQSATSVVVYDMSGRRVYSTEADKVENLTLRAVSTAGCYQMVVTNGGEQYVLRYIVIQ